MEKSHEEILREIGFYKGYALDYDLDDKGNAIIYKNEKYYLFGSETINENYAFKLNIDHKDFDKLKELIYILKQ